MTKLNCPFCGEKIEHIEDGWCNCKNRCTGSGSIELWLQFIRTRKALDVAVDALKMIDDTRNVVKEKLYASYGKSLNSGIVFCWTTPDEIHNTLAEIAALEKSELENLEMLVNNVFK